MLEQVAPLIYKAANRKMNAHRLVGINQVLDASILLFNTRIQWNDSTLIQRIHNYKHYLYWDLLTSVIKSNFFQPIQVSSWVTSNIYY